eukprot:4448375-Amphidinium_carterae.1
MVSGVCFMLVLGCVSFHHQSGAVSHEKLNLKKLETDLGMYRMMHKATLAQEDKLRHATKIYHHQDHNRCTPCAFTWAAFNC